MWSGIMANLIENEVKIAEYWKNGKINEKVRDKLKEGKKFYFLDGPPYVTGDLHPGGAWVKSVKDVYLRYKRYAGFNVRDRAGYDVHGLPIENKVEKVLSLGSKKEIEAKMGIEAFVKKCREYVDSFMGKTDNDYMRLGISMDFSNPYLPYRNEYIETGWQMLSKVSKNGFLYQGKRTTAYCTHCETALAQGSMEVEYAEREDPSIFVAFKIDPLTSKTKTELSGNAYLLVWTTTPWTLPANISIAANPKELYVLASAVGKDLIIAKSRLEAVSAAMDESLVIKKEFYGSELAGAAYVSPLEERVPMQKNLRKHHKIVFSEDLVSMNEGTGLVHIAPGHGLEDYNLGKANGLPVFSPVDSSGAYTEEAGAYAGIMVPGAANEAIMSDLSALNVLLSKGTLKHSYPQCWRCDTKLIYLATEQWFLNVQKVKRKLISENNKVTWYPDEARGWQNDVLENSPDWCISRQRYWGIPMPIWHCAKCGNDDIIGSLKELREKAEDKAVVDSLSDLHRPYIDTVTTKCASCGSQARRIPDVLDVWFDASIAFKASLPPEMFERMFPIDYIIEGKDQLRGWFSYLLKMSVMAYGKRPYKHVNLDGMILDETGKQMHKKTGNYKIVSEVMKEYGADTFRLWCVSHTPWLDLSWNDAELRDAAKVPNVLQNIANMLSEYQGAIGYAPRIRDSMPVAKLDTEEAWLISRLESTFIRATEFYDSYQAYNAMSIIKSFITEDFSRFYIKLAKKKILYGKRSSSKRTLDVVNYALRKTLFMISPVIPFITESIYQDRYKREESIFLESWPKRKPRLVNAALETEMSMVQDAITGLLSSREKAGINLRSPIARETLEVKSDYAYKTMEKFSELIKEYTNSKHLDVKSAGIVRREIKPLFAKLGPSFKERASSVARALASANADELTNEISRSGHYTLHTESGPAEILPEHFITVEKLEQGDAVTFKHGMAYVDKELSKELRDEASVREFERNVQLMRKEFGLKKMERIHLHYEAMPELSRIIDAHRKSISKNVNASFAKGNPGERAVAKEFKVDGIPVKAWISRHVAESEA